MAYRENGNRNGKGTDGRNIKGMREKQGFEGSGKRYDSFRYDGGNSSGKEKRNENRSRNSYTGRNRTENRNAEEYRTKKAFRAENTEKEPDKELSADNYILTGRNPIREALKTNRDLEKLLVQKGDLSGSAMEIVKTAKERRIMIQVVEKSRLDEIAPRHQGLIAFASAFRYSTVEEILKNAADRNEDPFLILLDGITDPHNLGAIIRSAECTGVHGIIVPQHRSVGLTPAAVKASAGAVEYLPIARVTNMNRTIEELQKKNIWVYALTMNGTDYEEVSFAGGTAVVIGAEGDGISKLTEEKCDVSVSLPMKGHLDSLNASVAAGVIMYRIMSARKKV